MWPANDNAQRESLVLDFVKWVGGFWLLTALVLLAMMAFITYCPQATDALARVLLSIVNFLWGWI